MKRLLINNYYSGVVSRGIITQIDNLCALLTELGIEYRVLRCPRWLRRLPRQGVLFHLFEQFYVPLVGLFYDVVIYPYNSASVFAGLHCGSVLIVHDFIQNRPKVPGYSRFSAKIVRITQCIYERSGRDVAFITEAVQRQARWIGCFRRSRQYILPNCFAEFRHVIASQGSVDCADYILLCTGKVPTKDLAGALRLYASAAEVPLPRLVILGLSGNGAYVRDLAAAAGIPQDSIRVLDRISTASLKEWYARASLVWVHSRREGFGRNVAEALLCGSRVVASRIPPFSEQASHSTGVVLYANDSPPSFTRAVREALALPPTQPPQVDHYEISLRNALQDMLR